MPGFGDPAARIVVLGLAPAAHGGNRTGRIFTGDRSGDWLFALSVASRAGKPARVVARATTASKLTNCWITAAVRCAPPANKPTPQERDTCGAWLHRELELIPNARVIVCLGAFAWDAALRLLGNPRPRPKFGHGAEATVGDLHAARQLPRLTAEHVHRQAHRADARRRVQPRDRAQCYRVA